MKFLVTGSAGFIGYHIVKRLLSEGHCVIGLDNLNECYDVSLKQARLNLLRMYDCFVFYKCDLIDSSAIRSIFLSEKFDRVIHLGGQSGVRYSLKNPMIYINSNVVGFLNILEECRNNDINHLVYASSSSVYGNQRLPFSALDPVNYPASIYAVTKRTNELMAYTYSYLYNVPTTGLRLFTVYGPWGRPDMALFQFVRSMLFSKSIDIYNYGKVKRSFTFIDDVIEVIMRIQDKIPSNNDNFDKSVLNQNATIPYRILNVANNQSVNLITCIHILEKILGVNAKKNFLPMQLGDINETCSNDANRLYQIINFIPETCISSGIKTFVKWYRDYYKL